jgi:UTP:GlnB (protein PII) uridylyltransferase
MALGVSRRAQSSRPAAAQMNTDCPQARTLCSLSCHTLHVHTLEPVQRASAAATEDMTGVVSVEQEDECTVLTIKNSEGGNILMALTGVFSMFDVSVLEASISTSDTGEILDVFRVTTADNKPV